MSLKHSSLEAIRMLERGAVALAEIEDTGVMVDKKRLDAAIRQTDEEIRHLQGGMETDEKIYKPWKKRFGAATKIGSDVQMREVLFRILKHKPIKQTDTGLDSVDKETLNHIDESFIRHYLKQKELKKIKSTYLVALKRELVRHDDKKWWVHPIYGFNPSTYRTSAQLVNIQNQPVRNWGMAQIIRSCFVAPDGYHMGEVDFSGAEVKAAACYNKDPNLIRYIKDKTTDMHRDQAMKLFRLKKEEVHKKTTRDASKNMFVFPQFYGSVYFQCAPDIWEALNDKTRNFRVGEDGISILKHLRKQGITELGDCDPKADARPGTFVHRVREVEKEMWEKDFRVYAKWKRDWWEQYQREGGFSTYTGFRVNTNLKRNEVINFPIQNAAFFFLLWVLIEMTKWLRRNKMKTKIVGQIHDSALTYFWHTEVDDVLNQFHYLITEALPKAWKWIIVPLEMEAELSPVGGSWAEKKEWVRDENYHWSPK